MSPAPPLRRYPISSPGRADKEPFSVCPPFRMAPWPQFSRRRNRRTYCTTTEGAVYCWPLHSGRLPAPSFATSIPVQINPIAGCPARKANPHPCRPARKDPPSWTQKDADRPNALYQTLGNSGTSDPQRKSDYLRREHPLPANKKYLAQVHYDAQESRRAYFPLKWELNPTVRARVRPNFILPFAALVHPNTLGVPDSTNPHTAKRAPHFLGVSRTRRNDKVARGEDIQRAQADQDAQK